jgi:hypothetical protein
MNVKKVGLLIAIILIIISVILFVPYERIYIKRSIPDEFMPGTRPAGLIESYANYVVLSYGNLLKQNQIEFYTKFMKFNSSEYALHHFSNFIEYLKMSGIETNSTSYNNMQKVVFVQNIGGKEMQSIAILKENKIFYFVGDKWKIEKVVEWAISQN